MSDLAYRMARACSRKIRYGTESEARKVAWTQMQEQDDLLEAYLCNYCEKWHVGHPDPRIVLAKLRAK